MEKIVAEKFLALRKITLDSVAILPIGQIMPAQLLDVGFHYKYIRFYRCISKILDAMSQKLLPWTLYREFIFELQKKED